jgi:hypothetical protein
MSEDNYNLNDVHPDLDKIIADAEREIYDESTVKIKEDFMSIEAGMWESMGNPDAEACVFIVEVSATTIDEALECRKNHPTAIHLNEPNPEATTGGMLTISSVIQGEAYECLSSPHLMLELLEKKPVGLIIRVGGWASQQTEVKPSEADDKQEVVMTSMITSSAMYTITRNLATNEVLADIKPHFDTEPGEQKLYDAMATAFSIQLLVGEYGEEMEAKVVEELRRAIKGD